MATSNIQAKGVENSIFFLEPSTYEDFWNDEAFEGMTKEEINESLQEDFWDYINYDILDNINSEEWENEIEVFDQGEKEWVDLEFDVKVNWCYYNGANITIECKYLKDYTYSKTQEEKIQRAIRKIEKILRKYSTEIKLVGRFSSWETIYEKV